MAHQTSWPREPTLWIENRILYASIPFTWNLPMMKGGLRQRSMLWDMAIVGGPAVELLPDYLIMPRVTIGHDMPGVLQRVNQLATRTTLGCTRRCEFCAIGKGIIEPGGLVELADWPDLPIICDNNLLAASDTHLGRVVERLARWGWADFNQGLDPRLLTKTKVKMLAEIKRPLIRLALDGKAYVTSWLEALNTLLDAGIAKSCIRSYCLIAFDSDPAEAWERCEFVQAQGVKALPMWYHSLDQLTRNIVTPGQDVLGWSEVERLRIMGYYYKHRGETRNFF